MTSDPPFGTLQVDNGVQLKREVGGKLKGIQLYGKWYVGGVPPGVNMQNETKNLAAPSPSFDGSIQDVQVNGETITLAGTICQMYVPKHHAQANLIGLFQATNNEKPHNH